MAYDLDFWRNSLLLHGDGATISDSGPAALAITAYGNAQLSAAQSKYGGSSLAFDGAGDYLLTPSSAGFGFGTGAFTVEAFVRLNNLSGCICGNWTAGAGYPFYLYVSAGVLKVNIAGNAALTATGAALATGTWYHVACVRSGSTVTLYVDGVARGSVTNTANIGTGFPLYIGSYDNASDFLNGNLDELRVTKGLARYTAAFTPPTAAFDGPAPGATAALTLPAAALVGYGGANAAAVFSGISARLYGGGNSSLLHIPPTSFYAAGHDSSGENGLTGSLALPSLGAYGGANAGLGSPSPALDISGTVVGWGHAAVVAPSAGISAAGTVGGIGSATLHPRDGFTLAGYSGAVCAVSLAGRATLTASGTAGGVGTATVACPLFELTASGAAQNHGGANLLAPSARLGATAQAWIIAPAGRLTAIGTAVVAATYEAYSINLSHAPRGRGAPEPVDEATRYTDFPFTHIVRYQGSYFGVAADGLYLLEGTLDDGEPIAYAVRTCVDDFQTSEKKTVASGYFGGRLGPDATITVYAGEAGAESYDFATPRGQLAQNHREKFGRGVKDRYLAIGVAGSGALELDTLELDINKLTRRI